MLGFKLKKLHERGDTIIEVLIVLAVLGLAFSISTATANKALNQARSAEEHSQAMGSLNSQVEMLRKALDDRVALPSVAFCMINPATAVPVTDAQCSTGSYDLYKPEITYVTKSPAEQSYYSLKIVWPGVGSQGAQKEEFKYKAPIAATGTSGGLSITPPPPPPPPPAPVLPAAPITPVVTIISTPSTAYLRPHSATSVTVAWTVTFGTTGAGVTNICTLSETPPSGAVYSVNYGASGTVSRPVTLVGSYSYSISCTSTNAAGSRSRTASDTTQVKNTYIPFNRYLDQSNTFKHRYSTSDLSSIYTSQGRIGLINNNATVASQNGDIPLYRYVAQPSGYQIPDMYSAGTQPFYYGYGVNFQKAGIVGYVRPDSTCSSTGTTRISEMIRKDDYNSPYYMDMLYTNRSDEISARRDLTSYMPGYLNRYDRYMFNSGWCMYQ